MTKNYCLVTGAAGFIGMNVCIKLLEMNLNVIGIDNLNNYYDVELKLSRLSILRKYENFVFHKIDIIDSCELKPLFENHDFIFIIHLAAQAGVRYSISNPKEYINSNLVGFFNILEVSKIFKVKHLVYASSSSVYGDNSTLPFSEDQNVDHPVSLYAATKKSNEIMAHSYSHLYKIPTTGLRFFTVYGPWGRPDMALFLFTKAILNNEPINIYNYGNMNRDFTYIDDIVKSIIKVAFKPATADLDYSTVNPRPSTSNSNFRIFNVGNNNPISLIDFINEIEKVIGIKAIRKYIPMQAGDVASTFSDGQRLNQWIDFSPNTNLELGINNFFEWYKKYYKVKR
jgi:UDP-glucuronate 4-epimerase